MRSSLSTHGSGDKIGATTLHHISIESLIRATGQNHDDLCLGCLTGEYPLCIKGEKSCPRHIDFIAGTYQSDLDEFKPKK